MDNCLVDIFDAHYWRESTEEYFIEDVNKLKLNKEDLIQEVLKLLNHCSYTKKNDEQEIRFKQDCIWENQKSPLSEKLREAEQTIAILKNDIESLKSKESQQYIRKLENCIVRKELER